MRYLDPEMRFFVIFSRMVYQVDLILHIMTVQNVSRHLVILMCLALLINYAQLA